MVEHQPSKLDTWVRFPSPALFFIVTVQPVSAVVVGLFFCNGEEPNPGLAWELDGCLRFRNASFIASGDYRKKKDVKKPVLYRLFLCYTVVYNRKNGRRIMRGDVTDSGIMRVLSKICDIVCLNVFVACLLTADHYDRDIDNSVVYSNAETCKKWKKVIYLKGFFMHLS